eukprot:CAMPEP_0116079252 /NCGR_PEP_ID=MMETSP0327-20121206/1044_1 /TAXON_ID=44447 /ORGANISM="Pseudo-nitzschia delicatissima, Strain B596" /LENGTH=666 /DNA_ID=CAMNT_0003569867 /DNA_START=342 /DNA_END=2342 /DNA_ORIENTATION=-
MSSSFTLPPVIRRFGRCGDWEEQRMSSSNSVTPELGESPPHGRPHGGATGTDRVKSFVNGIVGPFAACLAPAAPCGPGCTSDKYFDKQPSVVSPHLDRVIAYRDSRAEQHDPDDYYIRRHPHHAHHHRSPTNYHRPSKPVSSPTYPREPAATEETSTDKKKRSTDIAKPRSNDILCGRGGSSNRHLGNIHFRELVAANKQIYVGLTKKQKMLVARKIVDAIHSTGGRFLAKDLDTGMFYDIGLPRSLEKTSQALREKHSNEMPVAQPSGEDEGIETSVESHKELIKKENTTSKDETKGAATEEAPPKESAPDSAPSSKSAKKPNTEAPDLIIPPHLLSKFGPKGSGAHEEDWENNHPQALSPRSYHSDQQPHRSPYPPSPYHTPSGSSPTKGYPPHPPPPHHRHPRYPTSPVPTNGSQPYPPPHYYYPPHTPPYGRRPPDERYRYPPYDDREAYNADYYKRHPHAQYHRYPRVRPPHHGHPSPPPPPRGAPPPRPAGYPGQPQTSAPPPLPTFRPSPYYRGYEGSEPPPMPASPPNRVIYRNSNSGYVRGNTELSPGRQRELKRPRNETSDALSSAVKQSLSLDDRVVGKEREKMKKLNSNTSSGSSSPFENIVSPTTMLQTKTSGRSAGHDRNSSPTETKEDYSGLSGLAALSTAAFLKLDEDDK